MSEERLITLKRFWTIKIALISFVCISMVLVGYFIGTWKLSLKVQASAMAARNLLLTEPSAIGKSSQLITSGVPFCYNQGNIYEAKIIPTKRSLMPIFKTVQAEEF